MTQHVIGHGTALTVTGPGSVSTKWHDAVADAAKLRDIAELVNNPMYRRLHASWIIDKIQEILK